MSLQDLKNAVVELTPDERVDLEAFLQHLSHKDDEDYLRELDEASERLSAGKGVSLDELRKMVAVLDQKR
jgi:hypothetical protein